MTDMLQSELVNVWGDRGRGGNQVRQNIQSSRIWMDTYITKGYKWAHHKYMDGHIHN